MISKLFSKTRTNPTFLTVVFSLSIVLVFVLGNYSRFKMSYKTELLSRIKTFARLARQLPFDANTKTLENILSVLPAADLLIDVCITTPSQQQSVPCKINGGAETINFSLNSKDDHTIEFQANEIPMILAFFRESWFVLFAFSGLVALFVYFMSTMRRRLENRIFLAEALFSRSIDRKQVPLKMSKMDESVLGESFVKLIVRQTALVGDLLEKETHLKERRFNERLVRLARHTAHDIRSPLTALEMLASKFDNIDERQKALLTTSIDRIKCIADSLLSQSKAQANIRNEDKSGGIPTSTQNSHAPAISQIIDVTKCLHNIVEEKRIEFSNRNISISMFNETNSPHVISVGRKEDFERIASNLLNNSYEAINDQGFITISVSKSDNIVSVDIRDNGKGIPEHIGDKIFYEGFSFGKSDGNGLGLSGARKTIRSWGGEIILRDSSSYGTTIRLSLLVPH